MTATRDTNSLRDFNTEQLDHSMDRAVRFASEVKNRWRRGTVPDAKAILAEHPHLLRYRSLVLDLAVEEYKCRQASGEPISADEFAVRFQGMEKSLYFLLEVQRMLKENSSLGVPRDDILWPEPGDEFLGFSLLAELGQGTFAHVFLALEPSLGDRLVALKVAPQGQWEAEILGKLGHPNIVPVYSIQKDTQTGLTAVCMPFLGRVTLLDVIERAFANHKRPRDGRIFSILLQELNECDEHALRGSFDVSLNRGTYLDAVVHLAIQMTEALAFTHKQGIYHRDLKPSNILLSNNGHPLILDFNLSSDESFSPVRMGGTLPYMAPEQLQCLLTSGSSEQSLDPALSDLFSLGVIFYELLTGELPFGLPIMKGDWDDVALDLLARHKKGPRPLRDVNPDVDRQLASVIEGCLAFEPQSRPPSANSLADSLRSQQRLFRRVNRWSRRHPYVIAGSGIFLLLCGTVFGTWLALRDPYPIRLYREGLADLQHGKITEAIDRFDEALKASPNNKEVLLERGKTYYRQGNFRPALEDFQRVYALDPTGEVAAFRGHCLCRLECYREAIVRFQKAIATGYRSISLFNNLGYCNMRVNDFSEADRCFREAISLDPRSAIAWCNLLKITINRFDRKEITSPQVLERINHAAGADGPTAELFFCAAILESQLAKNDPGVLPHVFEHLRKAISFGANPQQIADEIAFRDLCEHKEFSSLLKLSPGTRIPQATDGLMPPF